MKSYLIQYFRYGVYLIVLTGFSLANAGSYEDFFRAVKRDDGKEIQELLSRGFDPGTPDPHGQLGLIMALEEPSPKVAKVLIAWPKIDLNRANAKGETPLMVAAIKGDYDSAVTMIKKGADVNKTGWTPLHYAASGTDPRLISLMIENSAYIDAESPNKSTPLMMAAMYGPTESVKLLLDEGADASLRNSQGMTAYDFAETASRPDAIKILGAIARAKPQTPPAPRAPAGSTPVDPTQAFPPALRQSNGTW